MMENAYLEDQNVVLPNIVDGPTAIGDLWDCQNSKLIGLNLFGNKLDSQNLQVNVIKELKYTLSHVRCTHDRHKPFQVSGEVALELMAGLIKIGGGAKYESDEQPYTSEEELLCHYDLKTFSVSVLPSAKEVMDQLVVEKIVSGEIKATHIVMTTILGAEVMASIRLRETKINAKKENKGNFFTKFIIGPLTPSAKVALGELDAIKSEDFEKKIQVHSKPFFNAQPVTVSEMFQFIEGIGQKVENEIHPAYVNTKDSFIFGVPLRFYMVPIQCFLDIKVERLYMQIKDDVTEKIVAILAALTDFQMPGYLMKQILEREPHLKTVLSDRNNPLVLKIFKREKEIRAETKQYYFSFAENLKGYKMGKFDQQHLLRLAHEIDNQINFTSVLKETEGFISEGRKELEGIHYADIDDVHQLRILTNSMDLNAWYQTHTLIKVLLRTGGSSVNIGRVTSLYEVSRFLKNIGVEVGIAVPVISEGRHDLSIKIDDSEKIYGTENISFVIKILLLLVNQADQTSTRLFTIYASLNGIKLPFQSHLSDLHSMINILSEVKKVKVTDSYLKLRELALERDGRWKFVMDLNALDSAAEAVDKFRFLNVQLSEVDGDWIVGNYGIESSIRYSNAPLLFIFKDEKLQAVCFDNADILLLIESFKPKGERFFKLLCPDQVTTKNILHTARMHFALKVHQLFQNKWAIMPDETNVSTTGAFSSAVNKNIEAIQVLVRSFLCNDDIILWGAMANVLINELPDSKTMLKSQTWTAEVQDCPAGFKNVNPQDLAIALKDFLAKANPFYAKVQLVLGSISCFQTSAKSGFEEVETCITNLTSDTNCPKQLREQLISCQEIQDNSSRFEKVEKILKKHLATLKESKFETIALFIQLLEIPARNLDDFFGMELVPKLVARLEVDNSNYPTFHQKLLNLIETPNYYLLLRVLAQIQYEENHLFVVCNQLDALTSIRDSKPLCQLLGRVSVDKLSVQHYRWLFENPKFVCLLETNASCDQLLQAIQFFHCQKSQIPDYIPHFFRENLLAMMKDDDMDECPDIIENVDQAVAVFRRIVSQNCVPDNFGKILGNSVTKSLELKTALKDANALFYWSEERKLFSETWTCETINTAYNQLIYWSQSVRNDHVVDELSAVTFNIDILPQPYTLTESRIDEENVDQKNDDTEMIGTQAQTFLGSYTETFGPRNFLKIRSILAEPSVGLVVEEGFMAKLLPYIIQRLKMWGIHVIHQENLAKLNAAPPITQNSNRLNKFVFDADSDFSQAPLGSSTNLNTSFPIARIDVFACINVVCHCTVFQDLLRIMSQFPTALPLILQDLHENKWDYVCLVPLLKSLSVKWEVQPGVVIHNHLFINPFKMIVAFRVGSAKLGSSGKSTILNQVMGTKHMFSSLGGPGADKGIPLTLQGSTEIAVLLQETCSYALWESVVKGYYSLGSNELLMLANVHGDALELPETFELLKGMATSYIAFFMPCTRSQLQTNSIKIQEMLDTEDIVYILVDPTPDCGSQPTYKIDTNQLLLDNTLATIRSVMGAAIQMSGPKTLGPISNLSNRIRLSTNIFTKESELLLTHIKKLGCRKARSMLQLQKVNPKYISNYPAQAVSIWQNEAGLRNLITTFAQILNLPLKFRVLAFAHLDHELSFLTAYESIQIREKLGKFQEHRRRLINLEGGTVLTTEQKQVIEQIGLTLDELDGMSFGMEHLYRELGRIYQAARCNDVLNNEPILNLPRMYAELLTCGHAIEIMDGDIGDMCGPWLDSICHAVCESYPDLRIFTLSIIGLQSSGKSTLLNALFSCKFAVSVGRCTRGLFMRLIFLDKSLANELNIDAILLIDTEGLGAPEKLNDPEAEHKDRLLATFAMSVSNLTLINVLGESVRDITDILQIVIVTMARLEKADISPDILMVQHLSERDSSKTMKGADEFCKALEEAVRLTDNKDMAIGVRNCKSLRQLECRVKNGQLLKQFRSFKNGASANAPPSQEYHEDVVDLYKTILNSCKQVTIPQKFHNWHELIQNYWAGVSTQDFSLRFKNIQEVHEFIDRGSAIAKVKVAIDGAFRDHRDSCETKLRQKFNELANNPEKSRNWEKEKEYELQKMRETLKCIPHSCELACSKCSEAVHLKNQLFRDLEGKSCQQETEITIHTYIQTTRESVIKHLSQMAEAIRVKHGWSCEFDAIIGSILMDKLKDKPNLSETERNKMVDVVWSHVEQLISSQQQVASSKRRICDEVKVEYSHIETVANHFCRDPLPEKLPDLRGMTALHFTKGRQVAHLMKTLSWKTQYQNLDFQQVSFLESKLDTLAASMMRKYGTENFERGMVRLLKEEVGNVLKELEADIKDGKLLPEFKWEVHVYALLKFIAVMSLKEEKWNRSYNPYYILRQNEDTYRKKIQICLEHGFGFDAEGRIVGDLLLKAIRKRGHKQGNRAYFDNVRSMNWLTSSENVRLTYFAKLANQVENGIKDQALQHFQNPKAAIETWFKNEVDSSSPQIGNQKFIETVDSELEHVVQEIRLKTSCQAIKAFIHSYLSQVEDIEYNPGVDLDSGSLADFEVLRTVILKKLDEDKASLKLRINMMKPSSHSEVNSLLGCVEYCFWCGSLCWGQAGHEGNTDSTRKHHACHQPEGLSGCNHKEECYLFSTSCDAMGDDWTVYWYNCAEGMSWLEAKSHVDFANWTFTPHHKSEFNELMKWFFLRLHNDIANSRCTLPARQEDLTNNGFFNLVSLDHILAIIKSRI